MAFRGVGMHKAPARVLVTLLLLLLGTATTCSSAAGRQGDSPDAPQLRKLLQSKLTAYSFPWLPASLSLLHYYGRIGALEPPNSNQIQGQG